MSSRPPEAALPAVVASCLPPAPLPSGSISANNYPIGDDLLAIIEEGFEFTANLGVNLPKLVIAHYLLEPLIGVLQYSLVLLFEGLVLLG